MTRGSVRTWVWGIVGILAATAAAAAEARFDVSYLWHRDPVSVLGYREQVGTVLGPQVAQDLAVVSNGSLYGLVYRRDGDHAGAVRVALAHSQLLEDRGLEPAAVIRAEDWEMLTQTRAATDSASAPSAPGRPVAAPPAQAPRMPDLEAAVERYIKGVRHSGQIARDERTAWSVYDFTTGEKLVTINEDMQFQAASLIKPFVAAAFFQWVADGRLVYGPKSRRHMERMIQHSSNRSTNWVMRQVGGPRSVQRILKRRFGGIFRETHIVEYIPRNGRTYRNKASAHDYSRFLYALWKDNIPGAAEIRRLMALPGPDRLTTGVAGIPPGTEVFNKTGSTARLCGDMGILTVVGRDGRRYPYTLIGIIEKQRRAKNYTTWIRSRSDVIRNVSQIVLEGIARHHAIDDTL